MDDRRSKVIEDWQDCPRGSASIHPERLRVARPQDAILSAQAGADAFVLVEVDVVAVDADPCMSTPANVTTDVEDVLARTAVVGAVRPAVAEIGE